MDRRQFFKLGLSGLRDAAVKKVPDVIAPSMPRVALDVTILTDEPRDAEILVDELLREHFGESMLRLRQSELQGDFPGEILIFENNRLRDFRDGISLFHAALRQLRSDLHLPAMQHNPTLIRYVSHTPPLSRSVEIFHRDRMLLALPLSENTEQSLKGSYGDLTVVVDHGRFFVRSSSCTHQTCVAHPPILTPGQRISCVPNEISAVIGAIL
jgi:hypothetical protein